MRPQDTDAANPRATPAANWRENGEPDPFGDRYNCERAALELGQYTDDEIANAVFLHGDAPLSIEGVMRGEPQAHQLRSAAKDRIRWLSRALSIETARRELAEQQRDGLMKAARLAFNTLDWLLGDTDPADHDDRRLVACQQLHAAIAACTPEPRS